LEKQPFLMSTFEGVVSIFEGAHLNPLEKLKALMFFVLEGAVCRRARNP
jgi:hypothetical protein